MRQPNQPKKHQTAYNEQHQHKPQNRLHCRESAIRVCETIRNKRTNTYSK